MAAITLPRGSGSAEACCCQSRRATSSRRTHPNEPQRRSEVGVDEASVFNHASTAGLNALLTRQLPKVALLTTEGLRDILDVGSSWRPVEALADPRWRRSFGDANRPLIPRYLRRGIRERLHADGSVFLPLDEEQARNEIRVLGRCSVDGVAIC